MKTTLLRTLAFAFCIGLVSIVMAAERGRPAAENPRSAAAETAPGPLNGQLTADYLLQPQDGLRVQVYNEEDINALGNVTISQEFTVFLPLIGTVNLKGKTARQAEVMIRDLYDKDYIVNPGVSVTVTKYADRTFSVFGSVGTQGRIQFPPERTVNVVDALSLAGGANRLADLRKVRLTRIGTNGETKNDTINIDEIIKRGEGIEAPEVLPGDVIYVPERIL